MVEELVAELGHRGRGGADAELAAVAVGREAAGFGDGLGFRGGGEAATDHAAVDAADELEHGLAVRERALPEVRDAALPDVRRVRGFAAPCEDCGGHGSPTSCGRAPGRVSGAGAFCVVTRSIRPSAANASSSAWRST